MLGGVHSTDARLIWPLVAPVLAPAVDRLEGRFSLPAVLDLIEAGRMQLWLSGDEAIESVGVTELVDYPHARAVRIVFGAGKLKPLLALNPMLEGWARENGCSSIEIEGRPGWERAAPPGYVREAVILRRPL